MNKISRKFYFVWIILSALIASCTKEESQQMPKPSVEGVVISKCVSYKYKFYSPEENSDSYIKTRIFELTCSSGSENKVVYSTLNNSADYSNIIDPQELLDEGKIFNSIEDVAPKDINGDKIPDLIVQNTAGNCCVNYTVLSLGESFFQFDIPYNAPQFRDIDNDGILEIEIADKVREYSITADYRNPKVVLEFKKNKLAFSERLMKMIDSTVSKEELKNVKNKLSEKDFDLLNKYLIEQIYSGNGNSAWNFLTEFSKEHNFDENEIKQDLLEFISFSEFKKEIYDLNKWKIEPINYECPY